MGRINTHATPREDVDVSFAPTTPGLTEAGDSSFASSILPSPPRGGTLLPSTPPRRRRRSAEDSGSHASLSHADGEEEQGVDENTPSPVRRQREKQARDAAIRQELQLQQQQQLGGAALIAP
jgi:hypothetical protein